MEKVVKPFQSIILLLFLAACTMLPVSPNAAGSGYPALTAYPAEGQATGANSDYGLENWLSDLATAGASIETSDGITDQGFAIQGKYLKVDGARVSVYEFANFDQAEVAAAGVSHDGSIVTHAEGSGTVGKTLDYFERIHWYRKGRLIVSYAGEDAQILDLLARILGPQFAGGFKLWGKPMLYP